MEHVEFLWNFYIFYIYFPEFQIFPAFNWRLKSRNPPRRVTTTTEPGTLGSDCTRLIIWYIWWTVNYMKKTRKEQQLLAIDTYSLSTQSVYIGRNCWCCMDMRMANTSSMFHLAKWKAAKDRSQRGRGVNWKRTYNYNIWYKGRPWSYDVCCIILYNSMQLHHTYAKSSFLCVEWLDH